ncbi:MAG: nucleotide exchange factor GrpE [Bacteroidales bacterium]
MSKKTKKSEEVTGANEANEINNTVNSENTKTATGGNEQTAEVEVEETPPAVDFENQLEEMKDKYLRLSAEFDNYRKRTLREKADILKYGSEDTLKDILPVVDDLDRALKAIETANDLNAVKDGLSLIVNKFNEFLKSKGIKEIEAIGQELNTDLHEAITKIPVQEEAQKGKIVDVIQKGYMIHDKVMRFSRVVVGE